MTLALAGVICYIRCWIPGSKQWIAQARAAKMQCVPLLHIVSQPRAGAIKRWELSIQEADLQLDHDW